MLDCRNERRKCLDRILAHDLREVTALAITVEEAMSLCRQASISNLDVRKKALANIAIAREALQEAHEVTMGSVMLALEKAGSKDNG